MHAPLNALRAFAATFETGGIRPAGRLLDVTHSAIARHVRELEAALGHPLVEREDTGRRLRFTETGEALGRRVGDALAEIEKAWQAASETRGRNDVVISAAPSVAALWLLPRLPHLSQVHPALEVSVLAEQRRREPGDEGSDLSIRMGRPRKGERGVPLMDDTLLAVAAPAFLRQVWGQRREGRDVAELRNLRLLHDRDPNASWTAWVDLHGPAALDLSKGARFNSSDLLLRAARQGQGVALVRQRLAADDLASGALVPLFRELTVPVPDAYWLLEATSGSSGSRTAVTKVRDWLFHQARQS
ncbi:LysR substrate-binding domain-containing protein [Thalassococcus sp. S3]|uniref:LysR substrate-binding domain-containing protein n=1 Tax=Thalassococcus sp. S3 TaxID=2017482 RepID=UPI0010247E20|nr:LysR substrate-binding domain-containing protein [Thalassococcus sp. S3]QBF32047.1 LysR family transcriptional regulator [Thalassococcus sp. S3]